MNPQLLPQGTREKIKMNPQHFPPFPAISRAGFHLKNEKKRYCLPDCPTSAHFLPFENHKPQNNCLNRQFYNKSAAFAGFAFEMYGTAMQKRQFFRNCEPEPRRTFVFAVNIVQLDEF